MSDKIGGTHQNQMIIIARSKRQADTYAYSCGISEYIHVQDADSLRGICRGLQYVYVPEYLYMMSDSKLKSIDNMLAAREHKSA